MVSSTSNTNKESDKDKIPRKGDRIGNEPIKVLQARKDIHKNYLKPWTTIGVALFIGVLWLLNVIIQNMFNAIIGLVAFILSIYFMVYGYYQKSQVRDLEPIIVYENGLDIPQPDGYVRFVNFQDLSEYSVDDIDGYETIVIQDGEDEYPVVHWSKLKKQMKKKNEPSKTKTS